MGVNRFVTGGADVEISSWLRREKYLKGGFGPFG